MTKIGLNNISEQIAQGLDKLDGNTDNFISSHTWNNIFGAKSKGGNEIRTKISVFNAKKSILTYLKRGSSQNDEKLNIATSWLDSVNNNLEYKNKQYESVLNISLQEVEVISSKTSKSKTEPQKNLNDAAILSPDLSETPVSTRVERYQTMETETQQQKRDLAQNVRSITGVPDIGEYVEIAKITKMSSLKPSNEPLNENVLNKAFDNVINNWLQRANKKRSILIGSAADFIKASQEQQVDTFLLMGISMQESACGSSKMALAKNNALGLTPNGRSGISCQSVADSINIGAKTLHNNVYTKGLDTINSVGLKGNYCCGNRPAWVRGVTYFANLVRNEYNRLLAEEQQLQA